MTENVPEQPAVESALPADIALLHAGVPLPDVRPEFVTPFNDDPPGLQRTYFDPERWDGEFSAACGVDKHDPVAYERGKLASESRAALVVSDFHAGDGSAAGDDFLDSHILPDEKLGVYVGLSPAGASRGPLFAAVLTFALDRVAQASGAQTKLDLVLNGDVINVLELKGRGGTLVSPKHKSLFRTLAMAQAVADVYWLRGNHDYVVPSGPWQPGEYYSNATLQLLVEHGDFWDKENWPPGLENKGSQLVLEAGAMFEAQGTVRGEEIKYLLSGVDNLRPWSNDAIEGFLDRRSKWSDIAMLAAVIARLRFLDAADDYAAYQGALTRRKKSHPNWLMAQGHTHVPAFVPGVYYNTGSWISTLVAEKGAERHLEIFPLLLVYLDRNGARHEEYYTVRLSGPQQTPIVRLETAESIDAIRKEYGYQRPIP